MELVSSKSFIAQNRVNWAIFPLNVVIVLVIMPIFRAERQGFNFWNAFRGPLLYAKYS